MENRNSNSQQPTSSLLIFNFSMNSSNPVFSHQPKVVELLANRFTNIEIITSDHESPVSNRLIKHTTFLNWPSINKIQKIYRLYKAAVKIEWKSRPKIVFYHMTDVQAALLGPIYKLMGKKQILWYAHTSNPLTLKFSSKYMNTILTSTQGSFPDGYLVKSIGQAIDVDTFTFTEKIASKRMLKVIHVGRLDPSKEIKSMIIWFLANRTNLQLESLTFVGTPTSSHHFYVAELQNFFRAQVELGIIVFLGPKSKDELPEILRNHDIFLHFFSGSLDKSILEATSIGLPVVTINEEYLKIFGTWSDSAPSNQEFLSDEFKAIANLSPKKLNLLLELKSSSVSNSHSLNRWINRLTDIMTSLEISTT